MNRFFGMMPSEEIKRSETFLDCMGARVRIDAGPNGWTVIWCDGSTVYADQVCTTERNFKDAYACADEQLGPLSPLPESGNNCEA